jgi:hypothetical protein
MTTAIPQAVIHHRVLATFTESLQAEHADQLVEWEIQVQKWELDHTMPCPYDLPEQSMSPQCLRVFFLMKFVEITFPEVM